jgi:STE24 endopeptidase
VPVLAGLPSESESLDEHSSRVFFKSQKYARAKMQFGLVTSAINCVEGLLVLLNIDKLWHFAGSFLSKPAPIPSALSYLVVSSALSMLTSLPASYYKTFVLEKEHGFNKSTRKTWIIDQIKTTVLSMAIGLPLTAAALWIIEWQGPKFVQYLTGFILAIQMVASESALARAQAVLSPTVPVFPYIQRLFNKFTLLQEYPESKKLHDLINSLAARLRFPLGKVYVIDGSTRSAHSNAYFIGLPGLTKQSEPSRFDKPYLTCPTVVLYDTLLKDQTPEQVEAVLAHELGHWAHRDCKLSKS